MKRTKPPVPDPEERPRGYRDREVLKNLYVERGWRRRDIADHFGVDESRVDHWIHERGVSRDVEKSKPPDSGTLAGKLYKIGLEDARS